MTFAEIVPHLLAGGKCHKKDAGEDTFIYLNKKTVTNALGFEHTLDEWDLSSENWEMIPMQKVVFYVMGSHLEPKRYLYEYMDGSVFGYGAIVGKRSEVEAHLRLNQGPGKSVEIHWC